MISPSEALAGVALPAGAALILGLAARLLPAGRPAWGGAALALAAGGGHLAFAFTQGAAIAPPGNGFHWVLWYELSVGLALLLPLAERWRWLPLAALTAGFWWAAILPLHPHTIATLPALALGGGLLALALGLGAANELHLRRTGGLCAATAATAALGTTAAAATLAGSLVQGQLAGCAAAAAAGLALAWPRARAHAGLGWAATLLVAAHAGSNLRWLYSDLAWPAAVLLILALPADMLAGTPWFARHPRLQAVARWALPALVGALAVAWTLLFGQPAATAGSPY